MDTNLVAPFDMYSDEYIVWMENKKGYFLKEAIRANVWIASIIFVLGLIFILLSISTKGENTLFVLLAIACCFFMCSFIIGFFMQWSMHLNQKKTTYYITNFRIIRYHSYKKNIYYYDFISNISDIYINESKDTDKTIVLSWKIDEPNYATIYCIENIDNINKVYELILSQKQKLEHASSIVFDTVLQ